MATVPFDRLIDACFTFFRNKDPEMITFMLITAASLEWLVNIYFHWTFYFSALNTLIFGSWKETNFLLFYGLATLNWPRFFLSPILFPVNLAYIEICRSVHTELTNFWMGYQAICFRYRTQKESRSAQCGQAVTATPFLVPVYTKRQRQRCDDASDTALIEINGVSPKWIATPILK